MARLAMSFNLWWAFNDGVSGHAWLSAEDMGAVADEMVARGMASRGGDADERPGIPVEKLFPEERARITPQEVEDALALVDEAPPTLAGEVLWRDWLGFLEQARHKGGILIRA